MPRDWDAPTYDRVSGPQARWGVATLERLTLQGDERVLDAGCGTGRVTEALRDRLPRGWVVALDASPSMLAEARARLGDDRISYVEADLGRPLPVDPVDVVFSTATFHWVLDHDALFAHVGAVLRPGGRLVAQCGGRGNIGRVQQALRDLGEWEGPVYFADVAETERRLAAAGFEEIDVWLHPEPTPFDSREALEVFLATVVLGHHLERLPEADRPGFVRRVVDRLPSWEVDYVRLNIAARMGANGR
jgi:trans-aconitate 2-methyltransferase